MVQESDTIKGTGLWLRSLEACSGDTKAAVDAKEALRTAFWKFRAAVVPVVARIRESCPGLTVHDVSHLDALWEVADKIAGPDYPITPLEAFLFGGAVLLHDAALCTAGFRDGLAGIKATEWWKDAVARELRRIGRTPTPEDLAAPPADIGTRAVFEVLRKRHAHRATDLIDLTWAAEGQEPFRLLADPSIRRHFGSDIGLIAKSHGLSVNELPKDMPRALNPLPGWPDDWRADCVKVACLLRVADAAQVDCRRAPVDEAALDPVTDPYSRLHWRFQRRITPPTARGDSLYYTGSPFPVEDADAWWMAHDTLVMVDRELRQVHALMADTARPLFAVSRVYGIESPERLADHLKVTGWKPVDAHIQATDIPRLVRTLGGEALYGDDPRVPLREMIQNAADAVRHRRRFEDKADDWGEIEVRLGEDDTGPWIEVADNGIGMTESVITRYLLNFTASYWGSDLMLEELPGLASKGVQATGKFGIGFFSVFMLGSKVKVVTRRVPSFDPEDGERTHKCLVLEFTDGVRLRPVLREAKGDEFLRDPGTVVRVWLKEGLAEAKFRESYDYSAERRDFPDWGSLCAFLAPALDVDLAVRINDGARQYCVKANDWLTMDPEALLRRLVRGAASETLTKALTLAAPRVRTVEKGGVVVGRGALLQHDGQSRYYAVVTVGGMNSGGVSYQRNFAGLLKGETAVAARNRTTIFADADSIRIWATDQGRLLGTQEEDEKPAYAALVRELNGDIGSLPVARSTTGDLLYADDIRELMGRHEKLYLTDDHDRFTCERYKISLRDNLLFVNLEGSNDFCGLTMFSDHQFMLSSMAGLVATLAAEQWSCPLTDVLTRMKGYMPLTVGTLADGTDFLGHGYVLEKPA